MAKHRRQNRRESGPPPRPNPRRGGLWIFVLTIVVIAALAFAVWKPGRVSTAPTPSEPQPAAMTNPPAPSGDQVSAGFQRLRGRWLRPDGGYVIEIRSVDATGQLDASYFNPRPIHVAKAHATREGDQTKVFIELRDVNYPGSTYSLSYVSENDQLSGIYYQALQGQRFEVVFVRSN